MSHSLIVLVLHADTPAGQAAVNAAEARNYMVLEAVQSKAGDSSRVFKLDTTDSQAVNELADQLDTDGVHVDILITCPATVWAEMNDKFYQSFEETDIEEWEDIISQNLRAPMLFCRAFGRRMRARGDGKIIQIVSNVAVDPHDPRHFLQVRRDGVPGHAPVAYSCAMAGVLALTRHLAADYGGSGVLINNLVFGPLLESELAALAESYIQRVPLKRIMTIEDLKNSLDLLLDPSSNYITGQSIVVDGGVSIW